MLSSRLTALAQTTSDAKLPPIRVITRGPKFHGRGYYDKLLFGPTNRYVLANEVDFEHRSPRADDVIRVGVVENEWRIDAHPNACCDGKWVPIGSPHGGNGR